MEKYNLTLENEINTALKGAKLATPPFMFEQIKYISVDYSRIKELRDLTKKVIFDGLEFEITFHMNKEYPKDIILFQPKPRYSGFILN